MARKRSLHMCIDRPLSLDQIYRAAHIAVAENPENRPRSLSKSFNGKDHPARMALETSKRWTPGRVLGIHFMDGTPVQKKKAEQFARKWLDFANIGFKFGVGVKAEIRISFKFDPGSSWSAMGTDCLEKSSFPKTQPTMNFGWLDDGTDDQEWGRVVVHEFGHALAAIHEHQNPKGGIKWNMPAVYAYFSGPPNNWSKQDIDFNVIDKYSIDQLNATKFDPKSIMLYAFPPELTMDHKGTKENTVLSPEDKKFIKLMYPGK